MAERFYDSGSRGLVQECSCSPAESLTATYRCEELPGQIQPQYQAFGKVGIPLMNSALVRNLLKHGLLTLIAMDLISPRSFKSGCFRKMCKLLDGHKVTEQVERVGVCSHNDKCMFAWFC